MNKIKLVVFDLNKTLIEENSWYDLNIAMGMTKAEDRMLMGWYDGGIISYEDGQKIIENIYKSRGKASYSNVLRALSKFTYKEGASEIVNYLKGEGYKLALISGSIDMVVDVVAKELGINLFEANNIFIFNEKDYFDRMVVLGDEKLAKQRHLEGFCRKLGIKLTDCACIGDGDNDIEIFKKTKHGITFRDSKIKHLAWKTIEKLDDLKNIL